MAIDVLTDRMPADFTEYHMFSRRACSEGSLPFPELFTCVSAAGIIKWTIGPADFSKFIGANGNMLKDAIVSHCNNRVPRFVDRDSPIIIGMKRSPVRIREFHCMAK